MKIEDAYLEDEVRDGFFISSIVKRSWANETVLLYELDRICMKYDIGYCLDWGTMLGAVRHGGFIPWDDDIDVVMARRDLDRFRKKAEEELSDRCFFIDFENSDNHWKFIVSFANTPRMCFEPQYLAEHYNFPYIASIDIFVMDNISDDAEKEEKRCNNIIYALNAVELIRKNLLSGGEKAVLLEKMRRDYGVPISGDYSDVQICREIFRYVKRQMTLFNDEECTYMAQLVPWGIRKNRYYPQDFTSRTKRIPFENIQVNVPWNAEIMLYEKYGEFHVAKKWAAHDYPYFETQRKELGVKDSYIKRYEYHPERMYVPFHDAFSLKKKAISYIAHMHNNFRRLHETAENGSWPEPDEELLELLIREQEMAIDFGTFVERVKGEGTMTVGALELLCEELYVSMENRQISEDLDPIAEAITGAAIDEIFNRTEIVFLSYKPENWGVFQEIWERVKQEETNCDLYVIPVPYAYKKYDGTPGEWICDTEGYPEDLPLTDYNTYDFSMHCPEKVYIQNPYDEFNMAATIPPRFYASAIRPFVGELVLVPYPQVGDFKADDSAQRYNMEYFCLTPGVLLSDRIWLSSKVLAERWKEMLTDWAGAETLELWDQKIQVIENRQENSADECVLPEDWHIDGRKVLLYRVTATEYVNRGKNAVEKCRRVLDIFYQSRKKIQLLWEDDLFIIPALQMSRPELADDYKKIVDKYRNAGWGIYDDGTYLEQAIRCSTAFYGNYNTVVNAFQAAGKPVMIQNANVE